jgi:hypothetical protein
MIELERLVDERLAKGRLPNEQVHKSSRGPGVGNACAACERQIVEPAVQQSCELRNGAIFWFHEGCFEVWDARVRGRANE